MSKKQEEERTCVSCQHVTKDKDEFCIRCGSPLVNRCADSKGLIDKGCRYVNKPEAAYCGKCGYPTVFKRHGLI